MTQTKDEWHNIEKAEVAEARKSKYKKKAKHE